MNEPCNKGRQVVKGNSNDFANLSDSDLRAAVALLRSGGRIDHPSPTLVVCAFLLLHERLVELAMATFPVLGIVDVDRAYDQTLSALLDGEPPAYLTFALFDPRRSSIFWWRLMDQVDRVRTRARLAPQAACIHGTRFAAPDERARFLSKATAVRAGTRQRLAGRPRLVRVLDAYMGPVFGRPAMRIEDLVAELGVCRETVYRDLREVLTALREVAAEVAGI